MIPVPAATIRASAPSVPLAHPEHPIYTAPAAHALPLAPAGHVQPHEAVHGVGVVHDASA